MGAGETCTFKVEADCGLPTFTPSSTKAFEIESIDYDDDDLNDNTLRNLKAKNKPETKSPKDANRTASAGGKNSTHRDDKSDVTKSSKVKGPRVLQNSTDNFKRDRAPPKPQQNKNFTRVENGKNKGSNSTASKGPQVSKFDPAVGGQKKFKSGLKANSAENICKKRYQQISVTALGNLTNSARILQSSSDYTMTLEIGTSDFSSASYLLLSAAALIFSSLIFF